MNALTALFLAAMSITPVEDGWRLTSSLSQEVQTGTVTGSVVNASSGEPLANAQVSIPSLEIGALTQASGRFLLLNVPAGTHTIQVTSLGYGIRREEVTVTAGGTTVVDFQLTSTAIDLDGIVITGTPGEQQARSIGTVVGSIAAADADRIAPASDVQTLLGTRVPGLTVDQHGGEVGSGGFVRLRGAASMVLSGEPLLYVDGIRVNNDPSAGGIGPDGSNPPSRINDINPNDIESIEIIKGPAASTLYGTEASNGVIHIITKKGSEGAPTVELKMSQGLAGFSDPMNMFPRAYYKDQNTGQVVEVDVLRRDREAGYPAWFTNGHTQSYGASVRGGTSNTRYYFSADWDRDEGALSYNWKNQLNARANLGYTPSDKLDLNVSMGTTDSKTQFASPMQPFTMAVIWACPAPGCAPGSGLPNALDGVWRGYNLYLPERYENDMNSQQKLDRTMLSFQATHRPSDWLTHRLIAGTDYGTEVGSNLRRVIHPDTVGTFLKHGRKQLGTNIFRYMSLEYGATATVDATSSLNLATSGGVQFFRNQRETAEAEGEYFPVRALETIGAGAQKTADGDFIEVKALGVYVQQQVSWKNRLFLTGALRGDDNSAFGSNFEFVTYPKVHASWVLSEEPFFAGLPLINQAKLRAAWGMAGQQPDVFAALRTYQPVAGEAGAPTLTPEAAGNPDLEPEVGQELELGFDLSLWQERIGLQFTHYRQKTANAIVSVPTIPSLGFPGTQWRNIGEITNNGWEAGIEARVFETDDHSVSFMLNFSRSENEIVDIGGGEPIIQSTLAGQYHVPGFPIGSIFKRRVVSGEIVEHPTRNTVTNLMCEGGVLEPGTRNLSRGGGAPVPCAEAPNVYWGQPLPTWFGGFHTTVTLFRNLRLYGLVDFSGGNTISNGDMFFAHFLFGNTRAIYERTDPILLGYEQLEGSGSSQPGIIDGGFAKLRTVSVSYDLPGSWAGRIGAGRASITVQGHNLANLWWATDEAFGVPQIDPETSSSSQNGLGAFIQEGLPTLRRFETTIRVTY